MEKMSWREAGQLRAKSLRELRDPSRSSWGILRLWWLGTAIKTSLYWSAQAEWPGAAWAGRSKNLPLPGYLHGGEVWLFTGNLDSS
jgi:hypothetical protein